MSRPNGWSPNRDDRTLRELRVKGWQNHGSGKDKIEAGRRRAVLPSPGGFVLIEGPISVKMRAFEAFASEAGTHLGQRKGDLRIVAFHVDDPRELMWGAS